MTLEERQSLVSPNITLFTQKQNEARAQRIELDAKLARMRDARLDRPMSSTPRSC